MFPIFYPMHTGGGDIPINLGLQIGIIMFIFGMFFCLGAMVLDIMLGFSFERKIVDYGARIGLPIAFLGVIVCIISGIVACN